MPVVWPLVKLLFKVVGPSIPDVVQTVTALKQQHDQTASQADQLQERFLEVDRKLAQQLELIESLTKQLELVHRIAQKALIAGCVACVLALIAVGTLLFTL